MDDFINTGFPEEFGKSPDDFLEKYGRLIYKVIYTSVQYSPELDVRDLFNDFYLHISESDFKRLRQYRKEGAPGGYLLRILRYFLCDQFRKINKRKKVEIQSTDQSVEEIKGESTTESEEITISPEPSLEDTLILEEESVPINEALIVTFSRLSTREKLIFFLTYFQKWKAKEIAQLLGIKENCVHDSNKKAKNIFEKELKERGIKINRRKKRKKGIQILDADTSLSKESLNLGDV